MPLLSDPLFYAALVLVAVAVLGIQFVFND
jgi:hypothetical protein